MSVSLSYLIVYNAHNGELTKIPKPVRFLSLQKLKIHLQESFTDSIIGSIDDIFLLTAFGIKLDYAMINEMTELYLYDRRLFRYSGHEAIIVRYLHKTDSTPLHLLEPQKFRGFKDVSVFRNASPQDYSVVLQSYEKWANCLAKNVRQISEKIDPLVRQINVIFKALNIIFSFASNFVESAEKTFNSQFNYVKLLAMKSLSTSWRAHFDTLKGFPTFKLNAGIKICLGNFLDERDLKNSADFVMKHLPGIVSQFNDLTSTMSQVNSDKIKVDKFIEAHRKESMDTFEDFEIKRSSLMKEFDSLIAKLSSDVKSLGSASSDDLQRYYKTNLATSAQLYAKASSMYHFLRSFYNFREKLALECPPVFENIASQQMKCLEVRSKCKSLLSENDCTLKRGVIHEPRESKLDDSQVFNNIKESENFLSTIIDLPLLFGFVLIEKRRQFEWHDFYSKGIVSHMSEHLILIIEHEHIFQKLWIKKFGRLIKLITPETGLDVHVPTVDVTLVNSGISLAENSVLSWLKNVSVEREDILAYIALVKNHNFVNNDCFGSLLDRNFKELIISTEKLKKITKTVASLGSSSIMDSGSNIDPQVSRKENGNGVDEDADLNMIKGLKLRINKLEDLLHQQQFKNLTGWPVVKNDLLKPHDPKVSILLTNYPSAAKSPISLLPKAAAALSRRSSLDLEESSSSRKVLDTSTTIDKHLDNIRLRKELGELQVANAKLVNENGSLLRNIDDYKCIREKDLLESETQIAKLTERIREIEYKSKKEISDYKARISELENVYRLKNRDWSSREVNMKQEIQKNAAKIQSLETENTLLQVNLSSSTKDSDLLRDEVAASIAKVSDLQVMNADLLSTMQAKEAEFNNNRSSTEKQTKDLLYKLDMKTKDFEDLMKVTQSKQRNTEELLSVTNTSFLGMLLGMSQLLASNIRYFQEFCVILESMGLLLVRELNDNHIPEFRIRRVKGLRSKKDAEVARPAFKLMKSAAVQDVAQSFSWVSEFRNLSIINHSSTDDTVSSNEELDALEAQTKQLVHIYETYISEKDGVSSKFSEFLKIMAFEENVQLQARDDGIDISTDWFFSNGIIKRFNDVEGFAKKLAKENKAKAAELSKCLGHSHGKLSVSNFQIGDLVLFLPTRIERVNDESLPESESTVTPWTAFNIDAPHYFLDFSSTSQSVSGEEWAVSRISRMNVHVVTKENAQNSEENPFGLSVGVTWHMVETE